MTTAEKQAYKARVRDLIAQGIDKVIAEVMAKAEIECGLIKPVVY